MIHSQTIERRTTSQVESETASSPVPTVPSSAPHVRLSLDQSPLMNGQDHEAEERDHQQRTGEVREPDAHADAEDVEQPDGEDQPGRDEVRETDADVEDLEVVVVGVDRRACRLAGEPRALDDLADEEAEEREHDGPAEPVAERRHRADEGEVLSPPLVRVQREAARLVREHRGHLAVEGHDEEGEPRGDAPEEHRAPASEVADGVAERPEEESGGRESDDEPVVPAEPLEELTFLDDCLSHHRPPGRDSRGVRPRATYNSVSRRIQRFPQ